MNWSTERYGKVPHESSLAACHRPACYSFPQGQLHFHFQNSKAHVPKASICIRTVSEPLPGLRRGLAQRFPKLNGPDKWSLIRQSRRKAMQTGKVTHIVLGERGKSSSPQSITVLAFQSSGGIPQGCLPLSLQTSLLFSYYACVHVCWCLYVCECTGVCRCVCVHVCMPEIIYLMLQRQGFWTRNSLIQLG